MSPSSKLLRGCATALLLAVATANPLQRPRRDSCSAYVGKEKCEDEAPNDLDCVWATTVPGDFDESNWGCIPQSCESIGEGEFGNPQSECTNFPGGGCTWHIDVAFCTSKGQDVPCEVYYADPDEGENCPSNCNWNADAFKCVGKTEKLKCDNYFAQDGCTKEGCVWHDDIYKCWEQGKDVPCIEYEYFSQEECPAYCKYITTGTDDFGNEEGQCLDKDAEIACEAYSNAGEDGASCPSQHCKWYESPMSLCWGKTKDVPCERMPGQLCAPEKRCNWIEGAKVDGYQEDGSCSRCPDGQSCVSTYVGPVDPNAPSKDTGLPCAQYAGEKAETCPEPRCFLSFDTGTGGGSCGGGSSGTCRDPHCDDLVYEGDECKKVSTCTYEEDTGICFTTGGTYPCKDVYEDTACNAKPTDCDWVTTGSGADEEGFCVGKGKAVPCSAFLPEHCPKDACTFNSEDYACVSKNYIAPCIEYEDEGECPVSRGCAWTNGVCWEEGKELPCSAICGAFQCDATGSCTWDSENFACNDCAGSGCPVLNDCGTYTTEETCPESKCEFAYTENGGGQGGQCVDKVCADVFQEAECKGRKISGHVCTWEPKNEECSLSGYVQPCDQHFDVDECPSATCDWDQSTFRCNEKGYQTPCHAYTDENCPSDRCSMDGTSCSIAPSLLPTTPPPLTGKGDGTGNEDGDKCTATMYDGIKGKLEIAETECIVAGRRGRRDDSQLECLAYILAQDPNKATVEEACPCLWFFAKQISPQEDHWMQIAC